MPEFLYQGSSTNFRHKNDLISLYSMADVLLITPIRDGMNLVAKEYVASKTDGNGVLILGEMAGTAKELGKAGETTPGTRKTMPR